MKKRVLSLLTALVLCMGLTVTALADVEAEQTGQVSGAYTYQVNSDGTATIVSFNKNWTYGNHNKIETLVIPSSLGGHPVTAIAGYAFTYYMPGGTKTIVIPEGVQRIESDAFVSQAAGASNEVTKIEVPSSVTYIGDGAFSNQAALQQFICRSKDVQISGSNVFYGVHDCTFYGYSGSSFQKYIDAMPKTYQKQVINLENYTYSWEDVSSNNTFRDISDAPAGTDTRVNPFTDVSATSPYYPGILWAVEKGITNGTTATTFSPGATCTRGQIVTFLWRAAGSPEPKNANPFTDVTAGSYCDKATAWAAEQGMADGKTFSPNAPCTRAMAVTFMWKAAGSPKAAEASFADVTAADAAPVGWAVAEGVTNGTTATTFSPEATCTRGQIVTFLYRAAK